MGKKLCALYLSFVLNSAWAAASGVNPPISVDQFIDKMVTVNHYDRDKLVKLFQQTAYVPEVIDRINRPFEEKPWDFYKNFFITPERIRDGVAYWRQHAQTLTAVSRQYGVSPAVIVAIIGIESKYGTQPTVFPELGTLATLAFHYPKRGAFFQNELENYLLLCEEYHLSPQALTGSYAGALGIPQFMPSTYRRIAINYDGHNSINLLLNHDDAIASIGNYLQKAGWVAHQPIAVPAKINKTMKPWLVSTDAKPTYHFKTLHKFGISSATPIAPQRKLALIDMHTTTGHEYWLTFQNFYAIMSYNPRTTYAMAIFRLSEDIRKAYAAADFNKAALGQRPH
jgi:membrane-bound lytic murein transglycosylase B